MYTISSLDYTAIVGISPYDSPISLFLKKLGKIPKENPETFQMKLGKKMEKLHRELLQERGIVVVSGDFNLKKHPEYPEFISVPDGFCHYNDGLRVVENKTCLHKIYNLNFFETQLRWEMLVCQCNGILSILTPDELIIKEIDRDLEWEKQAIEIAKWFLNLLEKQEMPSMDNYHPATLEALKKLERPYDRVELNEENLKIFDKIEKIEEHIKELEQEKDFLKSKLLLQMGEHKEGICGNYKLKVIDYISKPSITISEFDNNVVEMLNKSNAKFKINESKKVIRIDIRKLG